MLDFHNRFFHQLIYADVEFNDNVQTGEKVVSGNFEENSQVL